MYTRNHLYLHTSWKWKIYRSLPSYPYNTSHQQLTATYNTSLLNLRPRFKQPLTLCRIKWKAVFISSCVTRRRKHIIRRFRQHTFDFQGYSTFCDTNKITYIEKNQATTHPTFFTIARAMCAIESESIEQAFISLPKWKPSRLYPSLHVKLVTLMSST